MSMLTFSNETVSMTVELIDEVDQAYLIKRDGEQEYAGKASTWRRMVAGYLQDYILGNDVTWTKIEEL